MRSRPCGASRARRRRARSRGSARSARASPRERAALDHELADQVHQLVELADVDAHRLADRLRASSASPAIASPREATSPSTRALASRRGAPRGAGWARALRPRLGAARAGALARAPRAPRRPGARGARRAPPRRGRSRRAARSGSATRASRRATAAWRAPRRPRAPRAVSSASPSSNERMLEARLDDVQAAPAPQVLAQPVLLVLGERAQHVRVEVERRRRSSAARLRRARPGVDARDQLRARLAERRGVVAVVELLERGRDERDATRRAARAPARRARRGPGAARRARPPGGARARRSPSRPNMPGEPLQRVRRAEQPVHELGVGVRARAAPVGEVGEVVAHALEDLLGLGDELAVRLGRGAARRLLAARATRQPLPRARADRARAPRSSSGSNGFTRYASAPRPRPFSRSRSEPSVETMISGMRAIGGVASSRTRPARAR